MNVVASLRSWMRGTFRRSGVEQQMDDELRFHIVRAGLAPEEARRRACREFGGVEVQKEECRDALGLRLLDELVADGRYACRQLRRSPGFTAVAVLSLALGIGATSAIFSLMEAAVWKPIAVPEPERLGLFSWVSGPRSLMNSSWGNWFRTTTGGRASTSFSYPIVDALKRQQQVFGTVFAFKPLGRVTAVIDGEAELVQAQLVSGDFYSGLGVAPIAGRAIAPQDDVRGGTETVAVISDGYWARRFGRNPSAVGTTISVNQVAVTIVGVNAPRFTGVDPGDRPDMFMPLHTQPLVLPWRYARTGSLLEDPDYWWVLVMGRLKPGVSHAQAQSAMEVAFQQAVKATLPDRTDRDQPQFRLLSGSRGQDNLREEFATPLFVLVALAGLVLLIACANVASLLLARALVRRRELSLRLALGAGRWRIMRQLLTEGLALGVSGGALGLVLAYWTRNTIPELLLPSWASGELQFNAEFDARVLLLTIAVTIATTVLSSLAPIWQSLGVEINAALKDGGRAAPMAPAALRGKWLVVLQVCLSVSLLIGTGQPRLPARACGVVHDRSAARALCQPREKGVVRAPRPGGRRDPRCRGREPFGNAAAVGRQLADQSGTQRPNGGTKRRGVGEQRGTTFLRHDGHSDPDRPLVRRARPRNVSAGRRGEPAVRQRVLPERESDRQHHQEQQPAL